jgi:VanZ family protein
VRRYLFTLLPAWLAGAALSYAAIRMGLSEHYKLAFFATAVLSAALALNPGLQRLLVGFLAPLVIVLGFYSQWIPSMVEGSFSPRQLYFLRALDVALIVFAATFLIGSLKSAARVAIWIAVLFVAVYLLANYSGASGNAGSMVEWFMSTLNVDRQTALSYTITARKTIHVTFYGLVAWSAFWSGWHGQLRGAKPVLYALAIALILACFDESRQLGARARSGSAYDVLLDMTGAAAALAIAAIVASIKSRRRSGQTVGEARRVAIP